MNRINLQRQMYLGVLICLALSTKSGDGTFYRHARYMMIALRAHKFIVTTGLYNATQGAAGFISPKPSLGFEGANSIQILALTDEQRAFLQ